MTSRTYERFAGGIAVGIGIGSLLYAIAFVVVIGPGSRAAEYGTALLLLLGGILTPAVIVAVYYRVREVDAPFALLALLFGVIAAVGSAAHGAYDLANLFKPMGANPGLPHQADPRGLMTFGLTALSIAVVSWLVLRGAPLPPRLAPLGFLLAVLLVVVYLGRLIIFNPKNPFLLGAATLVGFILNPAWFIWLGKSLWREPVPRAAST